MQKIERLVAITLLLQARGKMTAARLASILGVSKRTIYRDIMALSLAHVPVSMEYGPGGGYYLPDDYHFESAIFTREEAVSLILSADMAGNYSLFAGDDGLHRALFKLEASLPEEYQADIRAARERILFDTTAWRNRPITTVFLETIRNAVMEARQMEILYPCKTCAAPGVRWRCIEPYGLVFKGLSRRHIRTGVWYLVAYCQACQEFTPFRVSYIEKLQVCNGQFIPQPGFNLRAYWREVRKHLEEQQQPFELLLRITPSARYGLGGNYTVLREEPGNGVVISVEMESIEAAISYVLALGADATVISPLHIRDAVMATAQAIAQIYISDQVNKGKFPDLSMPSMEENYPR